MVRTVVYMRETLTVRQGSARQIANCKLQISHWRLQFGAFAARFEQLIVGAFPRRSRQAFGHFRACEGGVHAFQLGVASFGLGLGALQLSVALFGFDAFAFQITVRLPPSRFTEGKADTTSVLAMRCLGVRGVSGFSRTWRNL